MALGNSRNPEITPEINSEVPGKSTPEIPYLYDTGVGSTSDSGSCFLTEKTMNPDPHQVPIAELLQQVMRDANLERLPHDPLSVPGVVRVLLSAGVSKILTESGEKCFTIISRASYPACPDRWVVLLKPAPLELVNQASGVLAGTHSAKRVRKPATATPDGKAGLPATTLTPATV